MDKFIPIAQIVVAVALIILILLQERSSGISSLFGGEGVSFYQTRRGLEKVVFRATIILAFTFITLTVLQLTH